MLNTHAPHVRTVVEQRADKQSVLRAIGLCVARQRATAARARAICARPRAESRTCCGRLDVAAIQELPGQVDQVVVEAEAQAKSQPFLGRDDPKAFAEHAPNLVRQQQAGELTPDLCTFRERRIDWQAIVALGELAELYSSRMPHAPSRRRMCDNLQIGALAPRAKGKVDEAKTCRHVLGRVCGLGHSSFFSLRFRQDGFSFGGCPQRLLKASPSVEKRDDGTVHSSFLILPSSFSPRLDEQRNHLEPCALLAQRLLVRRRGETAGRVEHLREEMNVAHSC